jgi:hypothetical protein
MIDVPTISTANPVVPYTRLTGRRCVEISSANSPTGERWMIRDYVKVQAGQAGTRAEV